MVPSTNNIRQTPFDMQSSYFPWSFCLISARNGAFASVFGSCYDMAGVGTCIAQRRGRWEHMDKTTRLGLWLSAKKLERKMWERHVLDEAPSIGGKIKVNLQRPVGATDPGFAVLQQPGGNKCICLP